MSDAPERIRASVRPVRDGWYYNISHGGGSLGFSADYVRADIHAARIEALEAANRGLVRLNEATEARAVTAEAALDAWKRISGGMEGMAESYSTALAAERDKVARLVQWLTHERDLCEAAGDRAGRIAYQRVLDRAALASVQAQEGRDDLLHMLRHGPRA